MRWHVRKNGFLITNKLNLRHTMIVSELKFVRFVELCKYLSMKQIHVLCYGFIRDKIWLNIQTSKEKIVPYSEMFNILGETIFVFYFKFLTNCNAFMHISRVRKSNTRITLQRVTFKMNYAIH